MTQDALEIPGWDQLPPLPPAPAYWGATSSSYTEHKHRGREHCDVCVRLAHAGVDLHGPPRASKWKRKGPIVSEPPLRLCSTHKQQYVTRDNEARAKAHLKPLQGGG